MDGTTGETPTIPDDHHPDDPDDADSDAEGDVQDVTDGALQDDSGGGGATVADRDTGTDVEEAELELTDDDLASGGDLFDGVDDTTSTDPSDDADGDDADGDDKDGDAPTSSDDDGEVAGGLTGNSESMEAAINDGAARLATVGLTDDDFQDSDLTKSSLEDEFRETFQAFRLGYYGSRAVDEYVLAPDDEEVSPAWGLAGSMLMAMAMAVWLRPDGAERVQAARETVQGVLDGGGGA